MIESYIGYGLNNLKHNVTIISIDIDIVYLMFDIFSDKIFKCFGSVCFFNISISQFLIFFTAHLKITKADKSENTFKMKHKEKKL